MFQNYLTVGLRALLKNRTYAFINVFGLAIGMAACLMILLFVRYEMSYDKWIPGWQNAYQVQTWFKALQTGQEVQSQMSNYASGPALAKDFPQIEKVVYGLFTDPVFFQDGQASSTKNYIYVNENFLDVMALPLVAGSRGALDHVGNALITQSEAEKRFGTSNVVGRTFTLISKGEHFDFKVGGVLKDLPKNSHLRINALIRIDFPSFMSKEAQFLTCWGCQGGWNWIKLRPGADPKAIEAALPAWEKRNIPNEDSGDAKFNAGDDQDWRLINIADVHLGKAQGPGSMAPGNDRTTIVTFAVIALLILATAVVNFTNLATARASQRAREVALRKVLGANRRQLIAQFIGESVIVATVAMLIALALVELLMPPFSAFLDAQMKLSYFGRDGIAIPVILLVLAVGVLGGLYPAFFLSRFQPAQVLKANKSSSETPGSGRLRSVLVVGQFAVSIALIICTAVVYGQTIFARTVDPGYKRDHLLQVEELNRYQLLDKGAMIADRVRQLPDVEAVGLTGIGIATDNNNNTNVMIPGHTQPIGLGSYTVDHGFRDAMGLKLLAGRWFERGRPLDEVNIPFPPSPDDQRALVMRGGNVVINALAAKKLGFGDPVAAIGKQIRAGVTEAQYGLTPLTIVGVVGDSRFRSVKVPVEPIMFLAASNGYTHMVVRFRGDPATARANVERAWRSITSEVPFNAKFSDDIIEELYRAEDARGKTFAGFALLSVIVGCLGLFGLAAFTAERRTKEIGIRKVLGARVRDIVRLLVWQFSKPVIVANLIAWPIAWWVMRGWLNGFDTRIALGPTPFLLAGGLALLIAVATVAGHAIRVARSNPIHALRYE